MVHVGLPINLLHPLLLKIQVQLPVQLKHQHQRNLLVGVGVDHVLGVYRVIREILVSVCGLQTEVVDGIPVRVVAVVEVPTPQPFVEFAKSPDLQRFS